MLQNYVNAQTVPFYSDRLPLRFIFAMYFFFLFCFCVVFFFPLLPLKYIWMYWQVRHKECAFSTRETVPFSTRTYRSRELSGRIHHTPHEVLLLSSLQILSNFMYHCFCGAKKQRTFHLNVFLLHSSFRVLLYFLFV